ncbi:hypothetical protein GCM10022206_45530 [Streptomyces chiangmaiensis]
MLKAVDPAVAGEGAVPQEGCPGPGSPPDVAVRVPHAVRSSRPARARGALRMGRVDQETAGARL